MRDNKCMKSVFLCFSKKNRELVDLYVSKIGNKVIVKTGISIDVGESFVAKARETLDNVDYIIILLTNEFLSCTWTINELSSVFMQKNREKYIVIRYPNVFIPSYLHDANIIEYDELVSFIDEDWDITFLLNPNSKKNKLSLSLEAGIEIIHKSQSKAITVVCGAGVSKQPSWNLLLNSMIDKYLLDSGYNSDKRKRILENIDVSGLEKAQFLQNVLKKDFFKILGYELYNGTNTTETTIKAVAEFCNCCQFIQSVITYNFDLILEEYLKDIKCRYTSICDKNKNTIAKGLPIYHVHGILDKKYSNKNYDLVFCEKSYHTQYSEPYSWSNLLQLEKFSNTLCIFVGISLTDPNMRRLLDIAHRNRKNSYHLMIMKTNSTNTFLDTILEQNANELGVSIVWVDDYKDIPNIIRILQSEIDKTGIVKNEKI